MNNLHPLLLLPRPLSLLLLHLNLPLLHLIQISLHGLNPQLILAQQAVDPACLVQVNTNGDQTSAMVLLGFNCGHHFGYWLGGCGLIVDWG